MRPSNRFWAALLISALAASFGGLAQISVSKLTERWVVAPGGIYEGAIEVQNTGEAPTVVEIRQTDYLYYHDGRIVYPPPGENPRSNAAWITLGLASPYITVPANSTVTVPYTIRVPDDPKLVGTYWSMVHVQFSGPPPGVQGQEEVTISHAFAYAIMVVTHLGDTGTREVRIVGTAISQVEDGLLFQVDLANPGERALAPVVWLEVYDQEGNALGSFQSELGRYGIYPGCSVRHRIKLPALKPGNYPALLIIDNLDEYVWGAKVTINVVK